MTTLDDALIGITGDPRVSDRGVRLWSLLLALGAQDRELPVSTSDYAQHLNCSRESIRRALLNLHAAGWARLRARSPRVRAVRIEVHR